MQIKNNKYGNYGKHNKENSVRSIGAYTKTESRSVICDIR